MDLKVYADITKVDPDQRMVYGYASTEALDSQGERVTKDAVEAALPDYMKFANIREMHQLSAVGVTKEATIDDKGLYVAAKVVDDTAWKKIKEGVYKGFSIGGKKVEKVDGVVKAVRISEISLVDRPANPETVFTMYKADAEVPGEKKEEKAEDLKKAVYRVSTGECTSCGGPECKCKDCQMFYSCMLMSGQGGCCSDCGCSVCLCRGCSQCGNCTLSRRDSKEEMAMAAKADDLAKAGARNSKADSDDLLKLSMTKGDELKKALDEKEAELKKAAVENETLKKKVSELEALPAPPKAALKAIEKTGDVEKTEAPGTKEPVSTLDLIKMAHKSGGVTIRKI